MNYALALSAVEKSVNNDALVSDDLMDVDVGSAGSDWSDEDEELSSQPSLRF